MSERSDAEFIRDIVEAISRISAYTTGMTYEAFLADTKTQDATVRNLEIIGEAVKRLSPELRARPCGYSLERHGRSSRPVNP